MFSLLLCFWIQTPIDFQFKNVNQEAGLAISHNYEESSPSEARRFSGGVAAGDYDGDGYTDLFVVGGDGPNKLYRNMGDGTFQDRAQQVGVQLPGLKGSGPVFADVNGDGFPDLFVGGLEGTGPKLLLNLGDGRFRDHTLLSGLTAERDVISAAFADYDGDGDLDLFMTHWTKNLPPAGGHLWRNKGDGSFECVDETAGITGYETDDYSFTPNFADIDNDGDPDLLVTGDFGTSKIYINQGDGVFRQVLDQELTDENGMGGAVGDYDNDGDLDWFVSSIWDPNPNSERQWTGNRLYRNRGDGAFDEVSLSTDVRKGYWGWGASFADFNLDGHLDLFQTNGWFGAIAEDFERDPSRFFLSSGQGYFVERSRQLGLAEDKGQGRGVVCLDYDRDGDLDLFVANVFGESVLYKNVQETPKPWLSVSLEDASANTQAVGARIYITSSGMQQMRELRAGSNFVSQNPIEAWFGVPDSIESMKVKWPDGETALYHDVAANRRFALQRQAEHVLYLPMNPLRLAENAYLTIIAPDGVEASVVVTAMDRAGVVARRSLPGLPKGGRAQVSLDHFPDPFNWLLVESNEPILAALQGRKERGAFAIPAVSAPENRLITPHIAANTDLFYTTMNIINPGNEQVEAFLKTPDDQSWLLDITVPRSGQFLDFESFWGGVSPQRTFAQITAAADQSLAGAEVFGYKDRPGMAGLSLTGQTSQRLVFSHVASVGAGWWTGLVVVNPSDTEASLQITAFDQHGQPLVTASKALLPGSKLTALIDGVSRGEAMAPNGFPLETAWVMVESDAPLAGYELFGTLAGGLFAGLQAGLGFAQDLILPFGSDGDHFAAIALVSKESGPIEITRIDDAGVVSLPVVMNTSANSRTLALARDLFPNEEGGYLRVKSQGGVHAFQLHGPHDGSWLVGLNGISLQ